MFQIFDRLKSLKKELQHLHRCNFSNRSERIHKARSRLADAQEALHEEYTDSRRESKQKEAMVRQQLLRDEDRILTQKSKDDWMNLLDTNTTYLYSIVRAKMRKQRIISLMNEQGNRVIDARFNPGVV
ncbi:hypothetical protein Dimus_011355 [Dionaea muscipula]